MCTHCGRRSLRAWWIGKCTPCWRELTRRHGVRTKALA